MRRIRTTFLATLLLTSDSLSVTWVNPARHAIRFITVQPGVTLEVLDFGGSGDALILLAGHGDTGHIFDDFAPRLTSTFRVFAITRRGFGASSQPPRGYDLTTLVQDIAHVIEALKLSQVHLAGHSIAGDELTRFALTYPEKVKRLIYLEAAYDRVEAQRLEAKFPKLPPSPQAQQESGSPAAVRAFVARDEILMPEAEIRATRVFSASGQYLRPVTPDPILHAVAAMVEHPDYHAIRVPILAIYAVYLTPGDLIPRYKTADPTTRDLLDQVFALWQPFARSQRALLRNAAPQARLAEIPAASHYVFLSHPDQVLREMRVFLQAP